MLLKIETLTVIHTVSQLKLEKPVFTVTLRF